jgi:malate/lactate dehydrogenase
MGVEKIIEYELDTSEMAELKKSAQGVTDNITKLNL